MLKDLQGTLTPARGASDGAAMQSEYDLVRWIGGGAFGKVFLVCHREERRHFVMKEVAAFASMEAKQREATELEVQLLREMRHPNIVGYRDCYVNGDGHLCIFMEYCDHGDAHSYMQAVRRAGQPPLPEAQVWEWLVQIALALSALHGRKILHRDLKTQNVFLMGPGVVAGAAPQASPQGRRGPQPGFAVKLGDLGIARVLDSTTDLAATQIGTPFSMSPEVFNSKPYSYESDVWGLGCIFYELVHCGQRPFEAQSINGLALKVLRGRFSPITAGCSDDAKRLIRSMLDTTPKKRPTLPDVLRVPSARAQIPAAVQAAARSTDSPQAMALAEEVLISQMAALGVDCPAVSSRAPVSDHGGPTSQQAGTAQQKAASRRQVLLHKGIERAERRKRREEETLKRLQETSGVLKGYLREGRGGAGGLLGGSPNHADVDVGAAPGAAAPAAGPRMDCYGRISSGGYASAPSQRAGGYGGASGRERQLPPPIAPSPTSPSKGVPPIEGRGDMMAFGAMSGAEDSAEAALSHRDRVLLRKEQRREEEQQRFEEEAKKIREENLAYQRAWVQGSKEPSGNRHPDSASMATFGLPADAGAVKRGSGGRPVDGAAGAAISPSGALASAEETSNPFRMPRPAAVQTPRRRPAPDSPSDALVGRPRAASDHRPAPPRAPLSSEPAPPGSLPRHRWNHWGGADVTYAATTSRSTHTVYLDSLNHSHAAEHSEESELSGSQSEGSDFGTAPLGSDEELWQQSRGVQRRIAQCRAAIIKHKSTIQALQEACLQEQQLQAPRSLSGWRRPPAAPLPAAGESAYVPSAVSSVRCTAVGFPAASPENTATSFRCSSYSAGGGSSPSAQRQPPAMVQDRIARLRRRCLEGLGTDKFRAAKECLLTRLVAEEVGGSVREAMLDVLGLEQIGYYSLIDQIVHMEQQWCIADTEGDRRRRRFFGEGSSSDAFGGRRSGFEQTSFPSFYPPPQQQPLQQLPPAQQQRGSFHGGGGGALRRTRSPGWNLPWPVAH